MNAATVRLLLAIVLFALYVLALLYLRRRVLTLGQLTAWGLFALLVPLLGPILLIASRPGSPRRRPLPRRVNQR